MERGSCATLGEAIASPPLGAMSGGIPRPVRVPVGAAPATIGFARRALCREVEGGLLQAKNGAPILQLGIEAYQSLRLTSASATYRRTWTLCTTHPSICGDAARPLLQARLAGGGRVKNAGTTGAFHPLHAVSAVCRVRHRAFGLCVRLE